MKTFCQIPGCNRETAGDSCYFCRIHICNEHLYLIPFFSDLENFWIVRNVMEKWRAFKLPDSRYRFQNPYYRTAVTIGIEVDNPLATYRNFYEHIVPHVTFPTRKEFGNALCETCLVRSMNSLNTELNRGYVTALRNVQRKGLICQIHDNCLLDVVVHKSSLCRCHYCGRHGCCEHIAECGHVKCDGRIVCVNFTQDTYGHEEVYGGCSSKHKHPEHLHRIRKSV